MNNPILFHFPAISHRICMIITYTSAISETCNSVLTQTHGDITVAKRTL